MQYLEDDGATSPLMVSLVNMAGTREVKKRRLTGAAAGTSPPVRLAADKIAAAA